MTTRWERLEEYLFDHDKDGSDFHVNEYVAETSLEAVSEGSLDIQSYLRAQRGRSSKTLYVLRRKPERAPAIAGGRSGSRRRMHG